MRSNRPALPIALSAYMLTCLLLGPLQAEASALERLFAPKPELWDIWLVHNDSSQQQIDHQDWDEFLKNNVQKGRDGITRIAYANLPKADINKLHTYIESMQMVAISTYHRDEQLAYWLNLYNATTANIILTHYPVKSIRDIDISPGFFSDGPWGKKLLNIEGEALSLNDIEHRILRPVWKDARIHYAVNCASLGCPNLRRYAYTGTSIDEQLEAAAKEFITHPRGVRVADEGVYVSSIYNWFQQDFGQNEADIIEHIKNYADKEQSNTLNTIKTIAGYSYSWALNDASEQQP